MTVISLLQRFQSEFGSRLKEDKYLYADTRIPWVSLYDHLALTAGIAVAMVEELAHRGQGVQEICGLDLPQGEELRALTCLCGLLHDIGKAREGETDYRLHVQRGVEYATEWLKSQGIEDPLRQIILGAVARHHLRDNPQTPLEKIICLADSYASAGDRPELTRAATKADFERIIQQTEKLERELFGQNDPICLLLGDTDAIRSYVYETSALPEIRGASQILQEVEEKIREKFRNRLAEECLIYCGGGGLLAIVPASQAQQWKQCLEQLYLERTCVATATIVVSDPISYADIGRGIFPYDDAQVRSLSGQGVAGDLLFSHFDALLRDRTKRKNFGELVARLTGRLQQAKRSKSEAPFLETLPVHLRCQSCGKRAAEQKDNVRDEWLCSICWQKRSKGRQERRDFVRAFVEWAKQTKDVDVPLKNQQGEIRFPADLDVLVGAEGKIALLYADGNNMGDLLQLMPSPASYQHFSQTLASATKESLFKAIWCVFGRERLCDPMQTLPFEIIALGGDDAVVIVPASFGWALAVQVLEEFEKHAEITKLQDEFNGRLGNALRQPVRLSLSAGVAIADVKYPVRFLFDIAEGLLKEAKRLAREKQMGTLCHLWLRAPVISEHAKGLVEELYMREDRALTARPYTSQQARTLTRLARQLFILAKSQRKSLAEAVEKGVHVSLNYALYQAARMSGNGRQQVIQAFEELGNLIGQPPVRDKFWFWNRKNGTEWRTALLDALELLELGAEQYLVEDA